MNFFLGVLRRIKTFIRQHPVLCGFYLVTLFLFLLNARYVDYPDEYVNLLAGKSILNFEFPYRDVWDHHLPGAWYLSAPLLLLSGGSFAIFRILWALFTYVGLLGVSYVIHHEEPRFHRYFIVFFFIYPMAALYFWFHLYLADSLAVFFFSLAFWLLMERMLHPAKTLKSYFLVSLLIFAMIFSSATFLYLGAALYLWLAHLVFFNPRYHELKHVRHHDRHRVMNVAKLVGVSLAPYGVYVLLLLVTGTLDDFYFANFTYNTTLYINIANYVRGAAFNPLKFALTIVSNFYEGYLPLLSKIKHLDLYLPIGTLAGLSTLTLLLLFIARSWVLGVIYFFILSFSAPRSNIQNYKETDYQSSMFLVLGLASGLVVLYLLQDEQKRAGLIDDLKRASRFLIGVFLLFTVIFLSYNSFSKGFQIYTQKLPTISNRGEASGFIDEFVGPNEVYFVGPYEPHEAFYVRNGELPGKYVSLLPQFRESNHIKRNFLGELEQNPPKIILFKQQSSIFGTPAVTFGKFLYDWMNAGRYTQLEKIQGVQILRQPTGYDLKTDLFILNSRRDEILRALAEKGYISIES